MHTLTYTSIPRLLNLMLLSQILDARDTDFACKWQKNHFICQRHPEIFQSLKFFMKPVAIHLGQFIPVFLSISFYSYFCSSFPLFWKKALNLDQQRADPHLNSISRPQFS